PRRQRLAAIIVRAKARPGADDRQRLATIIVRATARQRGGDQGQRVGTGIVPAPGTGGGPGTTATPPPAAVPPPGVGDRAAKDNHQQAYPTSFAHTSSRKEPWLS